MPIFYNKVQRCNPSDRSAPWLWYPILKSTGSVKEKQVAKLLADETTLNPKEAEMAIYQLLKVIARLLLDGNTVQLGELGSFHVTVNSEGSVAKEEANAGKIKKLNVRFSESAALKEAMRKASFREADSLSIKREEK